MSSYNINSMMKKGVGLKIPNTFSECELSYSMQVNKCCSNVTCV